MQELQVAAAQPVHNCLAAASVLPYKQASFFASLTWASLVIILGAWIEPHTKPASPLYTYLLWLGGLGGRGMGGWVVQLGAGPRASQVAGSRCKLPQLCIPPPQASCPASPLPGPCSITATGQLVCSSAACLSPAVQLA